MTATNGNGHVPADVRGAARYYLSKGRQVVYVPLRGKNPGFDAWEKTRLTPVTVDEHFPTGRDSSNIGILLGAPSGGLVDVDLDQPEAVHVAPFFLSPTGWVSGRLGKQRSHFWYVVDDPPRKAADKYKDVGADGRDGKTLVELRSTGGHTVVPPSLHEDTGERLVWHQFDEPARVHLPKLRDAVRAVAAAALLARHAPDLGSRHDFRLYLAGGLLRGGCSEDLTAEFIRAVCTAAGHRDLDDCAAVVPTTATRLEAGGNVKGWPSVAELLGDLGEKVVRRAREWLGIRGQGPRPTTTPKKTYRPADPWRPFPTDALPATLASYVRAGAAALGCDEAYLGPPALAVGASLIGNCRCVRLKLTWSEPSVAWSAVVGDSGTIKSPALQMVVGPVYRVQKRLLNEYRTALVVYQNELLGHQEAAKKARKEGGDAGEAPEEPVRKRVVCSDTTVEKLSQVLEENPRGVLVHRDELAGWLGSFSRYKAKGAGNDVPYWLEAFRAGPWLIDRKGGPKPTMYIPHAAASVVGTIQPGVLARHLTDDLLDSGLFARMLLAMPPKREKRWTEADVAPEVRDAYEGLVESLLALEPDKDAEGDPVPFPVRLSPPAKEAWVRFYNEWAREQSAAEGELAAALSKLEGYGARFALLHHIVTKVAAGDDCNDPVEPASVEAGAALVRWFAYEARRVYALLQESEEDRRTRRLVEFVRSRGGHITARELRRASPTRYSTPEAAEAELDVLVTSGLGRWEERPAGPHGGRPTRTFVLDQNSDAKTDETDETPGPGDPGGRLRRRTRADEAYCRNPRGGRNPQ
jgi:hypothetical protein